MRRMYSEGQLVNLQKEVLAEGNIPEIHADEIIENMSGYSFDKNGRNNAITYEDIFASVVKNGNKLTFVMALNVSSEDFPNEFRLGKFVIPQEVTDKLYTTLIGGYSLLAYSRLQVVDASSPTSFKNIYVYTEKFTDGIGINSLIHDMADGHKYYVRYEATFLLGENLAQE